MPDQYEPPSDFLKAVLADEAMLAIGREAGATLSRLIKMTRDELPANRDWATFLLAQQKIDTPIVREALLAAAEDASGIVRAEAILGLTLLDKELALPLLRKELEGESVALPIFEAAEIAADPSLVDDLRAFACPSGNAFLDGRAIDALKACEATKAP